MPFSTSTPSADGATKIFSIPFSYNNEAHVKVYVGGVLTTDAASLYTSTIQTGGASVEIKKTSDNSAVPSGTTIVIDRDTPIASADVTFADNSTFRAKDLNKANDQLLFAMQETVDKDSDRLGVGSDNKYDAQNRVIKNVADPVNDQDAVNKRFISTNIPNITTVAGISSDVTTVAGISANVTTVASDQADIGTVASNISSVNTVATNIADVVTVANDLNEAISEIETAANDLNEATSEIDTVANAITNVNTVGNNIADVNTVAGVSSDVTTVAGNNANVTTVAGVSGDVTTVAGISANVTAVAGDQADIGTVASNISDVNTVATNVSNVNTVAGNNTNVTTVAGVSSDVTSVAGIAANVTTVANNSANVTSVAGNATNINTVAGANANINTVATNIADVNNFADTYFVSATAPASPTIGDLWFDTTSNTMKVYGSSGFQNAGSSVNGTAERVSYTATAGQTTFAATYDAGYVDVYLNGIKLIDGSDFTATNGTSVVLTNAAALNDMVDIVAYGTFQLSNFSINDANDVNTTGVADGQILQYSGTNSRFEPVTFQGGAGYFVGENGTTGNTSTGLGDIFRVHEAALDTATTIPSNTNALAAGPLTLNAALTVNGTVTVV